MSTFTVNVNVNVKLDDTMVSKILGRLDRMSVELDALKVAVARNTTVDQSVITLVRGLAQQIKDLAAGATELEAFRQAALTMASELEASNQQVADEVVANTPAA